MSQPKIRTTSLLEKKKLGEKIVAITAYDYLSAKMVDELVDVVLVGDSLGMVIQGNKDTLPVTVENMIYHAQCVARGLSRAHLVVDMPFMSYQVSEADALKNAGRLMAEGGAEAVKLEGGVSIAKTVEKIVSAGIPVMGHIGLTPQSVHALGGYKIQGKTDLAKENILNDAMALEDAGAYSIVLEGIPNALAAQIQNKLKIPTIGIGAGIQCDGQILVFHDLLGLNPHFQPKFVKQFASGFAMLKDGVASYAKEVREIKFPGQEHSFQ